VTLLDSSGAAWVGCQSDRGYRIIKQITILLVALVVVTAACSSGDADSPPTETGSTSPSETTTSTAPVDKSQANLWSVDACTLLTDEEVAAVAGGGAPSEAQSGGGTVAAEDYDGASCRWKVSASQFVALDVYPTTADSLDELAAYNPWDRWTVETYSDVGDDARLVIATGADGLETAGTIQAIVVEEGGTGIRIAFTDKYPASPEALVAAVEQILAKR
jgi:hypothetical protein